MRCQLSSLAADGWISEEPERWDRTSACKGALLQPLQSMFWSHLAHPAKSDSPWHRGLRPLLFSSNVTGSFLGPLPTGVQGLRRQGQGLKVTAQWRDHLNLERGFTWYMLVLACLYSWPWLRAWTFSFKFLFSVLVIGTTQGETEEDAQIDSMDVVDSLRMRSCLKMAVLTLMKPKHSRTTAPKVQTFCGLPPTNLVTCSVWIILVTEMPLCSHTTQIFIILF